MTIIGKVKNINQMDVKKDFFISSKVTNVHKPNPDKPELKIENYIEFICHSLKRCKMPVAILLNPQQTTNNSQPTLNF